MKSDKKEFLEQLRDSIGCGKISQTNRQVRLDIFSPKDAKKIITLLRKHEFSDFRSQKEFDLWREAVEIILKNSSKKLNIKKGTRGFVSTWKSFEPHDLKRLFRIREEMRKYKKWTKGDYKWTHTLLARPF